MEGKEEFSIPKFIRKFRVGISYPGDLIGHEDNVGEKLLMPIFAVLDYDWQKDVRHKPRLSHVIISKSGLEPDYGICQYGETKEKSPLYGMVADVKRYGTKLTENMVEKLAGYCGLTGALYGVLTNGAQLIIIRPTRGVVEWKYIDKIPSRSELLKELTTPPTIYKKDDITYAKRIIKELDERAVEKIAERCHEIIRSRKGLAVPSRLFEFSKLLVARIMDERRYKEGEQKELLITSENIKLLRGKKAKIKEYVEEILGTVRDEIGIFQKGETIDLPSEVVEEIIDYLDEYPLWSEKMDVLGHIYEKFLMNTMTGQELGQYFTPRPIIDLMIRMVNPSLKHSVLDPACGSGGFLINALLHLKNKHNITDKKQVKEIAQNFYGIDVFEIVVKLSQINLWLHGDCHDNIIRADSLDPEQTPKFVLGILKGKEGFDTILTNPPFGAKGGSRLSESYIQSINGKWKKKGTNLFECAYWTGKLKSIQPQSGFMELCIKLLKEPKKKGNGGRLGIVVDNGLLSNTTKEAPSIREIIKRDCIVEAIIGLPKGTFWAYGSNVIPSFVILRRKRPEEEQGSIFRAEANKIGLVPSKKDYVQTSCEDLDKIYEYWEKWKEEKGWREPNLKVYDMKLPIWSIKEDDYRLDNNFFSPSSIKALEMINDMKEKGLIELEKLKNLIEMQIMTGTTPEEEATAIPIIEGINIEPNYVNPVFVKFTSEIEEERSCLKLKESDLLIVKDGSPAAITVVSKPILEKFEILLPSHHVYLIRLKEEYKKYAYYIAAFLNSKVGQAILRRYISGSVSPSIRSDELGEVDIVVPKKKEEYERIKEEIESLQKNIISVMDEFLTASNEIEKKINPRDVLPKLPINWMPAGKGDKHNYYKE